MFRVLMCIEALKCRMLNVEVLPKPAACRLKLPPDDPGVGTYLVVEPSDAEQQGENPPTDHPETMSAAQLQGKMAENHAGGAQGDDQTNHRFVGCGPQQLGEAELRWGCFNVGEVEHTQLRCQGQHSQHRPAAGPLSSSSRALSPAHPSPHDTRKFQKVAFCHAMAAAAATGSGSFRPRRSSTTGPRRPLPRSRATR